MMKKLLAVLLAALMIVALVACSSKKDDLKDGLQAEEETKEDDSYKATKDNPYNDAYTYEYIESTTIRITGFTGGETLHDLKIPETMNGKKVVAIGPMAFYSCSNLREVVIPDTVTEIGDYAFANCASITSVTMPATVSFRDEKELPVGIGAFYDCVALAKVTFTNTDKTTFTSLPRAIFMDCAKLAEINLPATVKDFGTACFFGCAALPSVDFSAAEIIGKQSFMNCKALTAVSFPATLAEIDESAFSGCKALASATFASTADWFAVTGTTIVEETEVAVTEALTLSDAAAAANELTNLHAIYPWVVIPAN